MRSSCIYTNNLNYFCCFNSSKGNKFPNLKCWTTGTFFNTSAINIFVMPVLTLFHDKRDAISFSIGECSKNGPRLTYSLVKIKLQKALLFLPPKCIEYIESTCIHLKNG